MGALGTLGGTGWGSPWQRRVYSGRFLRAVCTTSKSRLPRQHMNVGKKSAAKLRRRILRWAPLPRPRSPWSATAGSSAGRAGTGPGSGGGDAGLTWGCSGWSAGPGRRPGCGRVPQQSSSAAAGWSGGAGVLPGLPSCQELSSSAPRPPDSNRRESAGDPTPHAPPPPPRPQDPGPEALAVCRFQPRAGVGSRLNCEHPGQGQVQTRGAPSPQPSTLPTGGLRAPLVPSSLTEKKPRISGLRRDISSMSLRTSSTSETGRGAREGHVTAARLTARPLCPQATQGQEGASSRSRACAVAGPPSRAGPHPACQAGAERGLHRDPVSPLHRLRGSGTPGALAAVWPIRMLAPVLSGTFHAS